MKNEELVSVEKNQIIFKKSNVKIIRESLVEIKDSELVNQLKAYSPVAIKVVGDIIESPELFTCNISSNELAKAAANKYRGFKKVGNRISEHAEFKKVSKVKAADPYALAAQVAMIAIIKEEFEEIHKRLDVIDSKLDELKQFNENIYLSEIMSLVSKITNISKHQNDIIYNEKIRDTELINLDRYEKECAEKLGKVNLDIKNLIEKENKKFDEYIDDIKKIDEYQNTQHALLNILKEIANLKYLFFENPEQLEYLYSSYSDYLNKCKKINEDIYKWHVESDRFFEIDEINARRSKTGIKKIIGNVQGIIKSEWKYIYFNKDIINMINSQKRFSKNYKEEKRLNLFEKNVEIIIDNGKYYYKQND
ncbi:hypothetical protein LJB88_02650 [Erysipelotrichaceae bacterium OttesenSCG-928-M19]|nr:hypothetical protein [Erysipelotrichaceae bacterium OttesenSCG-928-M19]